jgi:hypothetical protein
MDDDVTNALRHIRKDGNPARLAALVVRVIEEEFPDLDKQPREVLHRIHQAATIFYGIGYIECMRNRP